jgi:hypothetical protein
LHKEIEIQVMNMQNRVIKMAVITLTLLFTSCMDDENSSILPPATSHGANTIGFVIDGQEWTTSKRQPFDMYAKFGSSVYRNELNFWSSGNILSSMFDVDINFDSTKKEVNSIVVYFRKNKEDGITTDEYKLTIKDSELSKEKYKFRIETESGRRVVYFSWQFDITLTNKDGKTVRLTQGRLDAKGD